MLDQSQDIQMDSVTSISNKLNLYYDESDWNYVFSDSKQLTQRQREQIRRYLFFMVLAQVLENLDALSAAEGVQKLKDLREPTNIQAASHCLQKIIESLRKDDEQPQGKVKRIQNLAKCLFPRDKLGMSSEIKDYHLKYFEKEISDHVADLTADVADFFCRWIPENFKLNEENEYVVKNREIVRKKLIHIIEFKIKFPDAKTMKGKGKRSEQVDDRASKSAKSSENGSPATNGSEQPIANPDWIEDMCAVYDPKGTLDECKKLMDFAAGKYLIGTRGWVFNDLAEWLKVPNGPRVFMIFGAHGIGKSVIAAQIIKRRNFDFKETDRSELKTVGKVAAYHAFESKASSMMATANAIVSIACQLRKELPDFKWPSEKSQMQKSPSQVHRQDRLKNIFRQFILHPCGVYEKQRPIIGQETLLVVIDALDECEDGSRTELLDILGNMSENIPSWLRFVVTCTATSRWHPRKYKSIMLSSKCEKNGDDVELFIKETLNKEFDSDREKIVSHLARKAEGVFQYAYYMLEGLKVMRNQPFTFKSIEELTASMPDEISGFQEGIFHQFFVSLVEKFDDRRKANSVYKTFLGIFVAARENLRPSWLHEIIPDFDVVDLLHHARCILHVEDEDDGQEGVIRFVHSSLESWLYCTAKPSSMDLYLDTASISNAHGNLGRWCVTQTVGGEHSQEKNRWIYKNALFHLCRGGDVAEAKNLLNNFNWLLRACSSYKGFEQLAYDAIKDAASKCDDDTKLVLSVLEQLSDERHQNIHQLAGQLVGRLQKNHDMYKEASKFNERNWFRPVNSTLVAAGALRQTIFNGHTDVVSSVAYVPDSNFFVSGSHDGTIRFWDLITGDATRNVPVLKGHVGPVHDLKVVIAGSCGPMVFSGGADRTIRMWDVDNRTQLWSSQLQESVIHSLAVSLCRKYIVTGSDDERIRVFLKSPNNKVPDWESIDSNQKMHFGRVNSVCFSSSEEPPVLFVSASCDKTARVWTIDGKKLNHECKLQHDAQVNSVAIFKQEMIVSGSEDGRIRLWDLNQNKEISKWECRVRHTWFHRALNISVTSVAFQPEFGKFIVSGSCDKSIRVWDAATYSLVGEPEIPSGEMVNAVTAVAFTKDNQILSASKNTLVYSWNETTRMYSTKDHDQDGKRKITWLVLSPEPDLLIATGSDDGIVQIHKMDDGILKLKHTIPQELVCCAAFSSKSQRIVTGCKNGEIILWDIADDVKEFASLSVKGAVSVVSFSEDDSHIVITTISDHVSMYEVENRAIGTAVALKPSISRSTDVLKVRQEGDYHYLVSGTIGFTLDQKGSKLFAASAKHLVVVSDETDLQVLEFIKAKR